MAALAADQWQRLEALFSEAAGQGEPEWSRLLDEGCRGDQELRSELEQLLEADRQAGSFIEETVQVNASIFGSASLELAAGQRVGAYRITGRLGRGGMCSVLLAERADAEFRRSVAVKIVRRGMDTADIIKRFQSERQILANLDHPNIARLLDGGTTDDGRPYFVLEHIDGLPVDIYCDQNQLSIRQRLGLFLAICEAVHHAHQNLVVHRDLKPSNVLVANDGTPKLLDFGIAKLLEPDHALTSIAATGRGMRLMTPRYASPEQLRGGAVTTATDVYSLGVLLYELLTGRHPFLSGCSLEDVERAVLDDRPRRPSQAVIERQSEDSSDPDGTPALAESRATTPQQLRRLLRGDLDTIVLTSLRRDPERRYRSVAQMAEDVSRFLDGRALTARRDTLRYRLTKLVRRHPFGAAMSALCGALILALLLSLTFQSRQLRHERDRATRVAQMLNELFRIADPGEVRGSTITARELLDRGARQIRQLEDDAETSMLLETLAGLYEELGLYASAAPLWSRALSIQRKIDSGNQVQPARLLNNHGRASALGGDYAAAVTSFAEALEIRRSIYPHDHPELLASVNNLALIHHDLGHYQPAAELYDEGLRMQDRLLDVTERSSRHLLANRALLYLDMGYPERAETLYREVLAAREQGLGRRHEVTASALDDLGRTLHMLGRLGEAEHLLREALEIRLDVLTAQHSDIARSQTNLGGLLIDLGQLEEAGRLLNAAVELRTTILGSGHTELAASLTALARWHRRSGSPGSAERLLRQAINIYRPALPEDHPEIAGALIDLGTCLAQQRRPAEAEPVLREALWIRQQHELAAWLVDEARAALELVRSRDGR